MTGGMLPESVSDFRLINRKTYQAISQLRESHRFLRGLGAWVGFRTTYVEIDRPPRFAGESKWIGMSLINVISLASRSILAYSATPLLFLSFLGVFLSILSFTGLLVSSLVWIFSGVPFAGYGTIVGLIALGFSLTMLAIGILAQYLALIYEEVKQRPLYIISEKTEKFL
jgi:dolichol-phosphate mannosyltransferase